MNDLWRWRQRRTSKKALDLLGKITILPGHHAFCYIFLLSLCIWAQLQAAVREISPPSERAAEIEPIVYTTRTLHFLFLHFVKDVNRRRRFSLSFNFLSLITALMNSTLGKFANMIIWMRWNYSDEVRNSTISKWPFRALLSPWWCMLKLPIPWLHHGPPKDGTSYRYNWDLNYRINMMM